MPGGMTAEQRVLRSKQAALTLHSKHDSRELTANARAAFLAKFIDQVDPERVLPEAERLRRAEYARRAHFARMALMASRKRTAEADARRQRVEKKQTTEQANSVASNWALAEVADRVRDDPQRAAS